ncbi:Clp protease N-terminal domain-containing protein [Pseudofrankia inefficax]|uniref:Clp domain protein n=1 Tax=Pseudofrankia inefficax (strain DSM 45817 / CECT 9037 / DDB 130130 / EuI1c) TaxID=298654 RepID=E3J207_PSEI1|nr:Clp protease N-terminal domain-containing protein [Pseudofrankia inefficax]ADP84112.1 Clp domain protein [Pseudofrankia inefficax]
MFERFTSQARHVVVLAQEEARELDHNYIGTEHLLLGLLAETDGIAAQALAEVNLSLEMTRSRVVAAVGRGKKPLKGHIPFTPRAKKVLEKALREALGLRHNYIGTEHVLLGLLALDEGLAATLLAEWKVDSHELRARVLGLISAAGADQAAGIPRRLRRRHAADGDGGDLGLEDDEPRRTAAADAALSGATGLAGHDPIGSHHLVLALLSDPDSAAARTLTGLGLDLAAARDALAHADLTDTSDELPEVTGRRGMSLRLTGSAVVLEATDQRLLDLARLAFGALRDRGAASAPEPTAEGGTAATEGDGGGAPATESSLRGDDAVASSLSAVWTALAASLADIRTQSTPTGSGPASPDEACEAATGAADDDERPTKLSVRPEAPLRRRGRQAP